MGAWVLENSLLTALVVMAVFALCGVYRRRPALCHYLWLLAFVSLVMPPLPLPSAPGTRLRSELSSWLPAAESAPATTPSVLAESPGFVPAGQPTLTGIRLPVVPTGPAGTQAGLTLPPLPRLLGGLWLLGAALVLLVSAQRILRFHLRLRRAPEAPAELRARVRAVASRLGVEAPAIRLAEGAGTPAVWCFGRPLLLMPARAGRVVRHADEPSLIAHELAHLMRGDHWVARLEVLATAACWWNPLFWVIRRQVREYAELACDAWALWAYPDHRQAFAGALIDAQEGSKGSAMARQGLCATRSDFRNFERRLAMIMRKDVSRQVSKGAAATALLTMLLVLPGLSGQEQAQGKVAKASQAALAGRRIDEQVELRRLGEKGEKLFAAKRYDEAIEVFERALALDPKNGRIHTRLGYMQIVQGDYQRAAKHFEIQAKLGYEPATAVYNLACAASLSGDAQRGLALLQQSVRRGFVNSELMAKDPDLEDLRGLEGFAAALEASRRSADLQAELKTLEAKKDLDGLAQTYRELASIATEDGVLQEQAGLALLRARDCDGALKAFQRQIAVGHQTGRGHYNSACAEALAGRREAALQELELAAKAGMAYDGVQDDPDLASLRGEARFQAVAERLIALQSFQDSIEKSVVSGDLEKARDSLQALLEDGSVTAKTRSWAAYALGRLQLEAKQPEASIASFQRAVTDGYPPGAPAFYIGVAHAGLGNADGALDYFEKALYLGFAEPKELAQALERCGLADGEKGRKLLDFAKKVATDAQKVEQEKKKAAASGWGDAPVLQRKVSGLDTMRRP